MALIERQDGLSNLQLLKAIVRNSITAANIANDFDPRFLNPEWWKIDKFGNFTNTWCRLYTEEEVSKTFDEYKAEGLSTAGSISQILADSTKKRLDIYSRQQGYGLLLHGVSIQLAKAPILIEQNVKGVDAPIITKYKNDTFDISITSLESTRLYWQQNSLQLRRLTEVLDSNQSLYITNPQLNLIYDIFKVVIRDYEVGQDNRFYSHTPISINCKADKDKDILTPITTK